jgi:hypothetical protein
MIPQNELVLYYLPKKLVKLIFHRISLILLTKSSKQAGLIDPKYLKRRRPSGIYMIVIWI